MSKVIKKTVIKSTRLAVELGTDLQIEILGVLSRFRSELIGMIPDEYIIVRIPQIVDSEYEKKCRNSRINVVVRYLYRGTVFGFKSKLKGIVTKPVRFMVIDYPQSIEEYNIRNNERISCIFPGKMKINSFLIHVNIMDISLSGCKVAIIHPDAHTVKQVASIEKEEKETLLMIHLPGEESEMAIDAVCKNVVKNPYKYNIGIQFVNMGKITGQKISKFIKNAKALK
ncbi:MAG: flagellar brake domain-containing protein [Candidatus Anammoxibacter sp.]